GEPDRPGAASGSACRVGEVIKESHRLDRRPRGGQVGNGVAELAYRTAAGRVQRHREMVATGQDLPDPPGTSRLRSVLDEDPYPVRVGPFDRTDEGDGADRLRQEGV